MTEFTQADAGIQRDRWGRPLIVPPDGGKPVAYTRVTTLAGALEDKEGLVKWKARMTLLGLLSEPSLMKEAEVFPADAKEQLDRICEQAAAAGGANAAAELGTLLHSLCEDFDRTGAIEPTHRLDVDAYARATERLSMLDIEGFGVLDELAVAGTWDRIVALPDGRRMVADIKTGDVSRPQKIGMQLALYARSVPYIDGVRWDSPRPDLTEGIVIHLPAGKGQCTLYRADLVRGWEDVQLALKVRAARRGIPSMPALTLPFPTDAQSDRITNELRAARTVDQLRQIWAQYVNDGWAEEHTAIANLVKAQINSEAGAQA